MDATKNTSKQNNRGNINGEFEGCIAWICIRCLETVKHILQNGGLMVIYHGAK